MGRRTKRAMVVAVGAVLVAGCATKPAEVAPGRAVRVQKVTPHDEGGHGRYTGSLEPRVQVNLAFKVGGKVASLAQVAEGTRRRPIQEGDRVRRGQLLAVLDDRDFRLRTKAATASLDGATAQERAAQSALGQAQLEAGRARRLAGAKAIPQADLDRAESALAGARENLAAAQAQRRARLEQVALEQSVVSEARLTSPVDGMVARRAVDVGETAMPGVPVFTIIDTSELRVVLGVPDTRISALRIGQRVAVTINALPGEARAGAVSKIAPTADPALRSYAVEVALENGNGVLKAGMVASASLGHSGEAGSRGAVLVPLSAVVRAPQRQGFAVYVLTANSRVSDRAVQIGDLYGNDVIVEHGLRQGETVVVEGAQFLRPGNKVEVQP